MGYVTVRFINGRGVLSLPFTLACGPAPSSTCFTSTFLLFKGMGLDGRGPNGGWQEDGSGMFVMQFNVTVALNIPS